MVKVLPYTEMDGIRTFKDSEIKAMYTRMVDEGSAKYVFKDGQIKSVEQFLHAMKYVECALYVIYYRDEMTGVFWLNRFEHRTARLHWCSFNGVNIHHKVLATTEALDIVIRAKDNDGYLFDCFLGYIPSSNKKALMFMESCGCKIAGEVPNLLWDDANNSSETGTIVYYVRREDENIHEGSDRPT